MRAPRVALAMIRTGDGRRGSLDTAGLIGAVLLVAGVAVFIYAHQELAALEGVAGTIGRALDPERQRRYDRLQLVRIAAGAAAAIGVVALVVDQAGD